jgi:hypothetical protein
VNLLGRADVEWTLVFTYGEFMNSYNIKFRCPDALSLGMATLKGYQFMINSKGTASIVPAQGKEVQGVIWRVTPLDEREIDISEGYDEDPGKSRCDKLPLPVSMSSGMPATAKVYIDKDTEPGTPNQGYIQKVITGAVEHALDKSYIDAELRKWKPKVSRETFTTY